VVAVLLLRVGLRPLTRALVPPPQPEFAALSEPTGLPALEAPGGGFEMPDPPVFEMPMAEPSLIEDVTNRPRRSPQRRLEQMVEFDENQAAEILKQWVRRGSLA
jgi:flagellar M-ring protein FliF